MDDTRDAYSVNEFCARHDLSKSFYYKLKNAGAGPREMQVGNRVLISREAAEAWRRSREKASVAALVAAE